MPPATKNASVAIASATNVGLMTPTSLARVGSAVIVLAAGAVPRGFLASLLLVILDDGRGSLRSFLRIQPGRATGLPLVEQVVGAVQLHLDRSQSLALVGGQPLSIAGTLVQLLLLVGQRIDAIEDVGIGHVNRPNSLARRAHLHFRRVTVSE